MSGRTFLDGRVTLHAGDCLAVLPTLAENSVDSVVCDPPYHLGSSPQVSWETLPTGRGRNNLTKTGFMGQKWDGGDIAFDHATWSAVLRVLKPGGHLLAFAAPKNAHRMVCAIEDVGFEIRDALMWIFGSGFPKSLDVSKAIDKAAGAKPIATGAFKRASIQRNGEGEAWEAGAFASHPEETKHIEITAPATGAARQWKGFGTALKPSYEPICLARKPLSEKTVAANLLAWGVGAINVDGCRVESEPIRTTRNTALGRMNDDSWQPKPGVFENHPAGRWPANLITDGSEEVLACFPESKGQQGDVRGDEPSECHSGVYSGPRGRMAYAARNDSGSAARFFYQVTRDDRCALCDANIAPASSKTGSTPTESFALSDAVDSLPPANRDIARPSTKRAKVAAKRSEECHPPNNVSAPSLAQTWPLERIAHNVSSAVDLCGLCATGIAQRLAEVRRSGRADKSPISLSIAEFKETILIQSLARYVEHRESTDTILTTESLRELFGSVFHAIADYTNSVKSEANTRSAPSRFWYSSKADADDRLGSKHPTVKPLDLMQYLVRLVTPPHGIILDPFAGTGTTGEAAWREGFSAILIEREAEYITDIERRMKLALAGPDERTRESIKARTKDKPADHGPLFDGAAA